MTHFSSPLWVVDPANVGQADPTSPSVQITPTGVTYYNNGSGNGIVPVTSAQITTTLTSKNILGMYATAVPLVPAPPNGTFIVVSSVIFEYNFGTQAYADGGDVHIFYTSSPVKAMPALKANETFTLAATTVSIFPNIVSPAKIIESNEELVQTIGAGLSIKNVTQAFSDGDGEANITVIYNILSEYTSA
jgi:hypothetical protein